MNIYQRKVLLSMVFPLFLVLACSLEVLSSDTTSSVELRIAGDKISADIKGVPLRSVLDKLMEEYGLSYKADEDVLKREVSVGFKEMPLEEGIRKILSPLSCLMVYGEKGRIERLFIVDVPQAEALGAKTPSGGEIGPSVELPPDYKPLPPSTPEKITSGPFVEPPPDYKPLPSYTPEKITSGPFAVPPPGYEFLPPYTPEKVTGGPFTEPPPDYKPLPPSPVVSSGPGAESGQEDKSLPPQHPGQETGTSGPPEK